MVVRSDRPGGVEETHRNSMTVWPRSLNEQRERGLRSRRGRCRKPANRRQRRPHHSRSRIEPRPALRAIALGHKMSSSPPKRSPNSGKRALKTVLSDPLRAFWRRNRPRPVLFGHLTHQRFPNAIALVQRLFALDSVLDWRKMPVRCLGGEIGRRARLKIWYGQPCESSSLSPGTRPSTRIGESGATCAAYPLPGSASSILRDSTRRAPTPLRGKTVQNTARTNRLGGSSDQPENRTDNVLPEADRPICC